MVWSVSTAKMFDRCQRQWFYKQHFANARSKDETRRKAYRLGKLQSVSGWRGSLVDQVLSSEVIPALARGEEASEARTLASGLARFDRQLAIARQHRIEEPGFKPSACGDDFAAFYAIEYGDGVSEAELDQARDDVQKAISTFFAMGKQVSRLRAAKLTIGIDVKNQTAAFAVVGKNGASVNVKFDESRQKAYPALPPTVTTLSSGYFYIDPRSNLLFIPPAEGSFLLHLPDLYHELAHPLLVHKDPAKWRKVLPMCPVRSVAYRPLKKHAAMAAGFRLREGALRQLPLYLTD